jgi:hypothetical protein
MCPLFLVAALVRLLVVIACLTLSLFMPNVVTGIGVWPLIWLAWDRVGNFVVVAALRRPRLPRARVVRTGDRRRGG